MENVPQLTTYNVNVDQTTVTVSGFDHGPVAHFSAATKSSGGFDPRKFCAAFARTFLGKIKKPRLVETPSAGILFWHDGSEGHFSHSILATGRAMLSPVEPADREFSRSRPDPGR